MGDMLEDQKMEIEALESIYPDEFQVMSEDPYRLSIDVMDGEGEDEFGVRLQAVLPPDYPNVAPELEIFVIRRVERAQLAGCTEHVTSLIEENLGMPMLFTLASEAKEWLLEHVGEAPDLSEQYERSKQQFETFSDDVIYDQEEATASRGTPVNAETFAVWKAAFDEEHKIVAKVPVVTGRMLFESGQVKADDEEKAEAQPMPEEPAQGEGEADPAPDDDDIDLDAWREDIDLDDLDGLDDLDSD
eukprot:TRINITY_DN1904_c0_g1_i1.p1 TRINITY_DN1904_c0_g1~~TRINITY_DN1904_c0_g1_i1.p1  ORF type:complete len:245 (+),score=92.52 TRINITY_DN1904_c0_g1_i1:175-909(+)